MTSIRPTLVMAPASHAVRIATLGYGDITPHLPFSQMLVVCEAMFGQFYVAVVLAWLVSMYANQRKT